MHKCEIIGCTTAEAAVVAVTGRRHTEEGVAVHKVLLVCEPHAHLVRLRGWHVKAAA